MQQIKNFEIIKPTDCHIHLRSGSKLKRTLQDAALQFSRAIIMPNLKVPITNCEQMLSYQQEILNMLSSIDCNTDFTPLMTLYLTQNITKQELLEAKKLGCIGCKLYPQGVTTNSHKGIQELNALSNILELLEDLELPLLVHAEDPDLKVDIFDREFSFIDKYLTVWTKKFPKLKIVIEHITTKDAVDFVLANSSNVAATITAHHLWLNRNDLFANGLQPHNYCLPIAKREQHRQALIRAAISGGEQFFLGTDSAPHEQKLKESNCGCAGVYTAFAAISYYAEIFMQHNALDKLEYFASIAGPNFYRLPLSKEKITLSHKLLQIPNNLTFANSSLIPFLSGKTLVWQTV